MSDLGGSTLIEHANAFFFTFSRLCTPVGTRSNGLLALRGETHFVISVPNKATSSLKPTTSF